MEQPRRASSRLFVCYLLSEILLVMHWRHRAHSTLSAPHIHPGIFCGSNCNISLCYGHVWRAT